MGNTGSSPTALQTCLTNVFPSNTGAISFPSDPLYQQLDVKPYNADIKINPLAVTRPSSADEVSKIVMCAADAGVKVQARSGGHSYGNYGIGGEDGAVVVDLVNFQNFAMDESTWQATFGSGTLLGDLTDRMHNAGGRAMAHGTCPQVGTGGHLTIGGLGPSSRQYGAALDHVLEVEVVLANGTIARANDSVNQDLFWAMKGAAASFGVITEFVVRTEPEPTTAVRYTYKFEFGKLSDQVDTFIAWQNFIANPDLDRKFATEVILLELGMIITGTYFGTEKEYEALGFEQIFAGKGGNMQHTVFDDWLGIVGNWAETEALQLLGGVSGPFYSKSLTFTKDTVMTNETVISLFNYIDSANKGTLIWFVILDLEAGAINDVAPDATAYGHRDAVFYLQSYAVGIPSLSSTTKAFITGINENIQASMPGAQFGAYAGYVDPQLPNGQELYWGTNLPRLEQIKLQLDPNDVFHNPQSVRPATSS